MDWKESLIYPVIGPILKALVWTLSRMRLPQSQGELRLGGLDAPIEVLRDKWGVPHIYAQSVRDALFAQGFVHAQERLWQMDFTRRVVAGRLAEVLGAAALPFDRAMRTLSLRLTAEREARDLSGPLRPYLDAFCAGINAHIDRAAKAGKLPVEFSLLGYMPEPWQLADTTSWAKLMGWTLASNWEAEFLRGQLVKRLGAEKTSQLEVNGDESWAVILDAGQALAGAAAVDATRQFTGPHAGEEVGSNSWVVHGSRTASGKPLLANDMHLELSSPAVWFENHLVGGELDVTGVTFAGVPLVVAGHNRHVAWGFTDGFADVQDLYEEHLRPAAGRGMDYEFKGQWLPAEVRHEVIRVKGGPAVTEEVVVTRHGPVVNLLFNKVFADVPPLAMRWTALDPESTVQALYGMNIAHDCREFREALRQFDGPSQNTVYADTQGNIAYSLNGRIPIRAKGDGSVPAPGWTGEYEWTGYIPFEDLPHLYNPARGYVATANNQVQRPDFPYFLARDYMVADRAARIVELLDAQPKVDIAYIQKMHFDLVSPSARALGRCLSQLKVSDPDLQDKVRQMRGWDGTLSADSPLAAIYEVTVRQAIRLLLDHHLGSVGVFIQGRDQIMGLWGDHSREWFIHLLDQPDSPWFDLGKGERRDDVLRLALRRAMDDLKRTSGPDLKTLSWGRLHQLAFRHVLGQQKPLDAIFNHGPFASGGDGSTIWATHCNFHDLDTSKVVGPPFRFIADLNDLDHCWGLLAPGQSGHLASPHFADGVKPWFTAGYHPMLFNHAEVVQNMEARLTLAPEARP